MWARGPAAQDPSPMVTAGGGLEGEVSCSPAPTPPLSGRAVPPSPTVKAQDSTWAEKPSGTHHRCAHPSLTKCSTDKRGYKAVGTNQMATKKTCVPTGQNRQKMKYPLSLGKKSQEHSTGLHFGKQGHSCAAKGNLAIPNVNKMKRSGTP